MYSGTSSVNCRLILYLNIYIELVSKDDVTRTAPAIPSLLVYYDTVSKTALTMHSILIIYNTVSKTALTMHSKLIIYNTVSKTALATPGLIKIWGIVQVFHPLLFLYVLLYHSTITVCSVPYQVFKSNDMFYTKL